MGERASGKQVAITVKRETRLDAKIIFATGFKIRPDKSRALIEIQLEQKGGKSERVLFDPVVVEGNLDGLKQYAAGLLCEIDDSALKEDISLPSETETYSTIVHLCQSGVRAETVFSFFRWADWVEETRSRSGPKEIRCYDGLVVVSSNGFQKKLVLELLSTLSEHLSA